MASQPRRYRNPADVAQNDGVSCLAAAAAQGFAARIGEVSRAAARLFVTALHTPAGTLIGARGAGSVSSRDGAVHGHLVVEVENHTHLNKVLRAVRRVKGVTEIARRDSGSIV